MLLIEDSRMFSTAIKYRLEKELGLEVTHCPSMVTLRGELQEDGHDFVLAVLDLNLPDAPNSEALDFIMRPFIDEEFYCRVNQNLDTLTQIRAAQSKMAG